MLLTIIPDTSACRASISSVETVLLNGGLENRLSATETMDGLVRYRWPGNIRELQNFVERAVILSPHSVLRAPTSELERFNSHREFHLPISGLAQVERDHILHTLEASNWIIGGGNGAAERLGMKRTSLVYRMRKLRISRPAA
jgi:formate hydrogenlyase transcriptional activator